MEIKDGKTILITGVNGFVGSHLLKRYLISEPKNTMVFGLCKWNSDLHNIEEFLSHDNFFLVEGDITDQVSIYKAIKSIKPTHVHHLAAHSFVPSSWNCPDTVFNINVNGTLHLLEALKQYKKDAWIQLAGSSEEYGLVYDNECPISEDNIFRPLSPYGVSKISMEYLGYQYYRSYDMKIICTRAFNHTGPKQDDYFICSKLTKGFAEIEKKNKEPIIYLGNRDSIRDFTDVRDIVDAYILSLSGNCIVGESYNICSGVGFSINDILNILMKKTNIDVEIKQDEKFIRPSDVPLLMGDFSKFYYRTGWKPRIDFETTLNDMLEYWKENG